MDTKLMTHQQLLSGYAKYVLGLLHIDEVMIKEGPFLADPVESRSYVGLCEQCIEYAHANDLKIPKAVVREVEKQQAQLEHDFAWDRLLDLIKKGKPTDAAPKPPTETADTRLEIRVETAGGALSVKRYHDPDYPGFTLYLDGAQCGVFEYNSSDGAVKLHGWEQADSEDDPTCQLTVRPVDKENGGAQ
jgi:hypothetical protein